jgi:hypothetical protein
MYDGFCKKQDKPILIIPAAGKSSRYPNMKPKWMLTHPSGQLMIEKVVEGMNLSDYSSAIIIILREHCEKYDADVVLEQAFGNNIRVVVLENPTSCSPETVMMCIDQEKLNGWIVIKDCDCLVSYSTPNTNRFVVGMNIKDKGNIKNLQQKSFVVANENEIVSEIVEKSIVSDRICLGVYAMHTDDLISTYQRLSKNMGRELYFSHVISELIDNGIRFFVTECSRFEDWGTKEDWFSSTNLKNTYLIDIDGVLLYNTGKYGKKNWFNTLEPISENVSTLKKLSDDGHELVFVTSRTPDALSLVYKFLEKHGIRYNTIVHSCLHSKRIVINDFAATNPFPSCIAINVPRNTIIEPYIDGRKD